MFRFAVLVCTFILALFSVDIGAVSQVSHAGGAHYEVFKWLGLGLSFAAFGAVLSTGALTLADWAKRLDPDGKVPTIVELLAQTNEILTDMRWIEGNLPTGHRTTVRTGLPTVAWRLLNAGVLPSKSTTAQIDEQCGMLEAWSEVDKDLALLNGNLASFRLSEARAFIEAMNQEMAQTLFYGNGGLAPEEFTGLSPRYSAISGATNGRNVLSGGGVGSDNTSIWLIVWNELTCMGIFPKGSKAGLIHEDKGEQIIQNAGGVTGAKMVALTERFQWKAGIALKNWQYVVRIANIDVSDLVAGPAAADLTTLMIKAIHRIPTLSMGKPAFYMNRTIMEMLDIQGREDTISGGGLTTSNVDGVPRRTFRGIPLNTVDALLETEATVT